MIDAAVGASAHRVIAVMPCFGYSRQDKKSELREPISARLVAHMLEAAGVDRVVAMDLHAGQVQGFFTKPLDHVTALFMLAQYFVDLQLEDLVVVAPDVGAREAEPKFADKLGADLALMTKERPAQQVAEIGYVIGEVKGKTALIIDDIIDTGGTLAPPGRRCSTQAPVRLRRGDARPVLGRRPRDHREGPFERDRRDRHESRCARRAGQHRRSRSLRCSPSRSRRSSPIARSARSSTGQNQPF